MADISRSESALGESNLQSCLNESSFLNTQLIRSRDDAAVARVRLIVGRNNIIDMTLSIKLVDAARQHIVHELHECFS